MNRQMRRAAARRADTKKRGGVNPNVYGNQVSRAIDRARLGKYLGETVAEMRALQDLQRSPTTISLYCASLLQGAAQAIAMAMKTIEGFEDEQGAGDEMLAALKVITDASGRGFVWPEGDEAAMLIDGFDMAVRILMQMPPDMKLDAWVWTESIDLRAKIEAGVAA